MMATTYLRSIDTPGAFERGFTIAVLLFLTGAFLNLIVEPGPNLTQSSGMIGMQIAWGIVYLIMFTLLFKHCPGFIRIFFRQWWLVLLMALVLASATWSVVPGTTFRRGLSVICTTFFGLYFALRYDWATQLQLLRKMCLIAVVMSYIFGILQIGHSVDDLRDVWIGIYSQKNGLGRMMVFSAMIFLLEGQTPGRSKMRMWMAIAASFVLILLSKSSTSLGVFFLLLGFYLLRGNLRGSKRRVFAKLAFASSVSSLILYFVLRNLATVMALFKRDVTLTGRLYIWVLGTVMALQKPWLGYGYSAFWLGPQGPSGKIWAALNWAAPGAHNGMLELWLDLGLAGVGLFIMGFLLYAWKAVAVFRSSQESVYSWPLIYLAFLVFMNFTESTLLSGNVIFWALYTSVAIDVSLPQLAEAVSEVRSRLLRQHNLVHGHA